jgi:YidC/Oxa1 family membrane protein insertase
MISIFYNVIIGPIELLIEFFYSFLIIFVRNNHGFAVLGISVIISFLCFPLYIKTEGIQEKERSIQKKLSKRVNSIRTNFKGDERYMILSMYYRENNYHPIMALRSSLGLLIQIPFFIAAYNFLSQLAILKGESFFFINDLGEPDSFWHLGSFPVNILPLLMTVINIISGMIYTRGFMLKERMQLYLMAIFFLVILYNSPAALAIYWISNNIFSLIKNIIYRSKYRSHILYFVVLTGLFICCVYVIFFRPQGRSHSFLFSALAIGVSLLIAFIPVYVKLFNRYIKNKFIHLKEKIKDIHTLFIISVILLGILCGIFIPFNVVSSDPTEFFLINENADPFSLLWPSLFVSLGLYVFWPVCIYLIGNTIIKTTLSFIVVFAALFGIINTFFFFGEYGMLSQTLSFAGGTNFSITPLFSGVNLLVGMALFIIIVVLYRIGKIQPFGIGCAIIAISITVISFTKIILIQNGYNNFIRIIRNNKENSKTVTEQSGLDQEFDPVITLSRTGKNVFIIMLDKAIGSYFPAILNEREELHADFQGFVYYPNTLSFFRATILGAPPLFGGYEYSPENMHKRQNETMLKKHNESYLVLPTLFQQKDYSVSVFDLPYINYQNKMDTKFFTEKGMKADNLDGKYNAVFTEELGDAAPAGTVKEDIALHHNFVMFSIFTIAPALLRSLIYDNGNYWAVEDTSRLNVATRSAFTSYAVLHYLPQITSLSEKKDTFTILTSNMAHDASFLQYPDYTVVGEISNFGEDRFNGNINSFQYYHVNVASYLLMAKWFKWLQRQNVYDNTRIIIVSDHAEAVVQPGDILDRKYTSYNPILLVKDFDARGDIEIDTRFMTNADTPLIAVQDIIPDAINPFTGMALKSDKENGINVFLGGSSQPQDYLGWEALDKVSRFYHVKDDIFNEENWTYFTRKYD